MLNEKSFDMCEATVGIGNVSHITSFYVLCSWIGLP